MIRESSVLTKYILTALLFFYSLNYIEAQNNSVINKAYKLNWRLVFRDEFDSTGLNYQKWRNDFPWGRWTHGLQYSTDGYNFLFDQSHLCIRTDFDTLTALIDTWDSAGNYKPYYKHFDYTSGMIYSNRSFKYGYFESKVKIPATKGLNSAFWFYGPNDWEVDVFEIQGSTPNIANTTLHWKDNDPYINSTQSIYHVYSSDSTFAQKEYTFGLKWKQKELIWYLDNKEIKEDFFTEFIRSYHIPDVSMNVIFTCEVGTMDGPPDQTSFFPSFYNIDYFRAYSDDTIAPPVISGQVPLTTTFPSALAILPNMLIVNDYYKMYPAGFRIEVMEGNNYKLAGNVISPLYDSIDTLYVPVKVNDGIDNSVVYNLKISVLNSTPVQQTESKNDLVLFPNPVKQILKLNLKTINEHLNSFDIFDPKGVTYLHGNLNDSDVINVSMLRKGIYFVSVTTNKGKRTLKFVKE